MLSLPCVLVVLSNRLPVHQFAKQGEQNGNAHQLVIHKHWHIQQHDRVTKSKQSLTNSSPTVDKFLQLTYKNFITVDDGPQTVEEILVNQG